MEPSRSTHTLAIAPASKLLWYEIRSVLGQGGFGITYLARDTNLDQDVAVKEYLPSSFASRDSDGRIKALTPEHEADYDWGLERFIDEGRTLARFDHPGIVRVLSVFEENSTAYLVMRYEKGEPMSAVLQRQGTIAEGPLKRIVIEILEGLKQVHDAGFIHRDIKPANIYLRENGSAVLIDFGAARQALGIQTQTLTTIVSPGYAPFEQYYSDGTAQGPWTDIYALGATAYRAISGKAPLAAVDRSQRILAGGDDSLVTATELGTGNYSAQFLRAVDQALAFRDAERPQSIADWREMLTRAPDSEAGRASTQVETEKTAERVDGDNTDSALQTTKVLGNESSEAPTIAVGTPPGNFRVQPPTKKRFNKKLLAVAVIAIIAVLIVARKNVEPAPSESAVAIETTPPRTRPVVDVPAPDPARERAARIAALLEAADTDIEALRLTTPPGNNAFEKYNAVLSLEPQNEATREGIDRVVNNYLQLAQSAAETGDIETARRYVSRAAAIRPDHPAVQSATARLARRDEAESLSRDIAQRAAQVTDKSTRRKLAGARKALRKEKYGKALDILRDVARDAQR